MSNQLATTNRFRCECGATLYSGGEAVMHSFDGHDVVVEAFRGGKWVFAGARQSVMDKIVERLRLKGESVNGFIRRLNERMDQVERENEKQEQNLGGFSDTTPYS